MKIPNRTWSDPLVCKLMARYGGLDAEEIVLRQVRRLLAETDQRAFPVDIETIASVLGIKRRIGQYPFAGRIFAEPSGQLVMDLSSKDLPARRRFTCGHEITHTVFPGFSREARYRVDASVGNFRRERDEEEFLCDIGAAELLLPRELVLSSYDPLGGLREMERLSEDAAASLEASGNRLVDLSDGPLGLIVLEVGHKPADRGALRMGKEVEKRLRVRYAKCKTFATFVPRFKSASDESPFMEALKSNGSVSGVGELPGSRTSKRFRIEAKRYDRRTGEGSVPRVLAFVRPT